MKSVRIWYFLLIIVMLIWGSFFPLSKLIVTDLNPLLMAFLRYFLAIIPMVPVFLHEWGGKGPVSIGDTGVMVLLGLLGITSFSLFLFFGIKYSTSTSSSILVNSQPIFTTLLSPLFIQEKYTIRQFIGVVLGLFGMAWVVTGGDFSVFSFSDKFIVGNIFGICAAISISIYYILLKKYVILYGSVLPTFITMTAGTLFLFFAALIGGAQLKSLRSLSGNQWLMVLYLGVVCTALVYLIFNKAIDRVGVIKSTAFKFLIPIFAVILSIVFLKETVNSAVYFGISLVIVSILFIQIPGRK